MQDIVTKARLIRLWNRVVFGLEIFMEVDCVASWLDVLYNILTLDNELHEPMWDAWWVNDILLKTDDVYLIIWFIWYVVWIFHVSITVHERYASCDVNTDTLEISKTSGSQCVLFLRVLLHTPKTSTELDDLIWMWVNYGMKYWLHSRNDLINPKNVNICVRLVLDIITYIE